jgi:hypothetical protein
MCVVQHSSPLEKGITEGDNPVRVCTMQLYCVFEESGCLGKQP